MDKKELREQVMLLIRDSDCTLNELSDELITLILDEVKPIESALKALVELKDYKDEFGKTTYYIQRQPVVWNDARRAIDNLRGSDEQ